MAETFNSVPLGKSNSGAATVFDPSIVNSPLRTLQYQQKFNAAQQAAAERARLQKEQADLAAQKDLIITPQKTSAIYQADISKKAQNYMDEWAAAKKASGGKAFTPETEAKLRKEKLDIEEKANYGAKVTEFVHTLNNDLLKDKELNPDFVAEVAGKSFFNPDGSLKYANDFQLNNLPSEIRKDPRAYNEAEIAKNLEANFNKESKEKFSRNGSFDMKTVTENNLPYMLDEKGKPVINPKTGRPQLFVNDHLMTYVDNNPNARAYIDAKMAQDEAHGIEKPRTEYVKELLEPNLRVKESTQYMRRPIGKTASNGSKNKKQPTTSTAGWGEFALSGQPNQTSRTTTGEWKPDQTAIVTPAQRYNTDKNDKPYVITVTPQRVYNLNADGNQTDFDPANRNPLKVELGPTVIGMTDENNKPIYAPRGLSAGELQQWFTNEARKRNGKIKVGFFSSGVVADKTNVDLDMASTGETTDDSQISAKEAMGGAPKTRQTQRRVMFPITEFNRHQIPEDLKPDDNMNQVLKQMQQEIMRAQNSKPSTKPAINDLFGFNNSKTVTTVPTTKAKKNPLGF